MVLNVFINLDTNLLILDPGHCSLAGHTTILLDRSLYHAKNDTEKRGLYHLLSSFGPGPSPI